MVKEKVELTEWSSKKDKYIQVVLLIRRPAHRDEYGNWCNNEGEYRLRVVDSSTRSTVMDEYLASAEHVYHSYSVKWSPDGTKFCVLEVSSGHDSVEGSFSSFPWCSTELEVYSSKERKKLFSKSCDTLHETLRVCWSPNTKFLATGYEGEISILNGETGKEIWKTSVQGDEFLDAWSEDGNYIITKGGGKTKVYTPFVNDSYSEPYYDRYDDYDDVRYYDPRRSSAGIPSIAEPFIPPPGYPGWK